MRFLSVSHPNSDPMPANNTLWLYIAALIAVYILPGADMAMVMQQSAQRGWRGGLQTALGLALSRSLHVSAAGLGLAAAFQRFPSLFVAVRWLGAAYLLWLTWGVVQSLFKSASDTHAAHSPNGLPPLARGFLTNLLNPKAFLFTALLLPQFIHPGEGELWPQYLRLGSILVLLGLAFDALYTGLAVRISQRPARHPLIRILPKLVFASIFTLTALRLITG